MEVDITRLILGTFYFIPTLFFLITSLTNKSKATGELRAVRFFTHLILAKFALYHFAFAIGFNLRDLVSDTITILATTVPLSMFCILVLDSCGYFDWWHRFREDRLRRTL